MNTIIIVSYLVGFFVTLFGGTFFLGWSDYFRDSITNIRSVVWAIILLFFASTIWPVSVFFVVLTMTLSSIYTFARKMN